MRTNWHKFFTKSRFFLQEVAKQGQPYFNVAAFSDPGDQIAGNGPRFNNALRGDGIRNVDFSLFKNFTYRELVKLQLRGEFFNFTNTVRFQDPGKQYGSTQFGVISGQGNSPHQAQMGLRLTF